MTRLSHKALKEMGKALNGKYYDGNIYAHENRVYYLSNWRLCHGGNDSEKVEIMQEIARHEPEILPLAEKVASLDIDCAVTVQLAYSCGIYGNSGQLHKIDYYSNDKVVYSVVLYV